MRNIPAFTRLIPLALALGALAATTTAALAQERQKVDEIVALVEEDLILRSELDEAIDSVQAQIQAQGESTPPRSAMESQVLERLILSSLEVQRAREMGIRISDVEVDRALNQVAESNNMSLAQLRTALEQDGYDIDEFRNEIREEMLSSRLRQRVAESMNEITETEVEIHMASERFGGGEMHLSQIVIGVPETASPQQVEQAQAQAEEVYEELQGGMEFASAAISFSQSPDALEGGEIGWRNPNSIPAQISDALDELDVGQFTRPIRTPAGFGIYRLNDQRDHREVIVQEYQARHIMIEPSELITPEEAQIKSESLYQRIRGGEDFGELARTYSDDETSANIGGRLNWFPSGAYGRQIQEQINQMEPGDISQPFQIQTSWHIVMLEDVREADRTDEAIRSEVRETLRQQRAEEEVDQYLRQLRGESFVEIRL